MAQRWHMGHLTQALLLSAVFVGAYFVIRAIPARSCNVLHYNQFINEMGEVDYCGAGEADFYDLSELRYPLNMTLHSERAPAAGTPTNFILTIKDYTGKRLGPDQIAISHTERLHLMLVDRSLGDYRHVHPQPTGEPGEYSFEFTPREGGRYWAYLDCIPIESGRRMLVRTDFDVSGQSGGRPLFAGYRDYTSADGYKFVVSGAEQSLAAGQIQNLQLRVTRPDGQPASLEPVMDAWAHMVAFDARQRGFAHMHPLNLYLPGQSIRPPDEISFSFIPDRAGDFRLWVQVRIDGRDRFAPFDIQVRS